MRLVWILLCLAPLGAAPIELSLKRAVEIAASPEGNTRMRLSAEALKQAQSRSAEARAALLPDVSANFTDEDQTRNLAAQGIQIVTPDSGLPVPDVRGSVHHHGRARHGDAERFRFQLYPALSGVQGGGFGGQVGCGWHARSRWRRRWRARTWRRCGRMPTWRRRRPT